MPYRLYSTYYKKPLNNKTYETWWDLIGEIVHSGYESSIAHNENDLLVYWRTDCYYDYPDKVLKTKKVEVFTRHILVYDEYDRIINLNEIREGLKQYKEQPAKPWNRRPWYSNKYFEYRREPVPYTGKSRYHNHWRRTKHSYLKSYLSTYDIIDDPRINQYLDTGYWWDDDDYPAHPQKNWKSHRRTQWK